MPGSAITIVGGTTTALTFQLLEAGVPINLTGITVSLTLEASDGTAVTTAAKVATVSATLGTVSFTPALADLSSLLSPYTARWKLTADVGGAISYVPTGYRDIWNVVKV